MTTLQGRGFNHQLLDSEKHAVEKLKTLDDKEIERTFVKHHHPRALANYEKLRKTAEKTGKTVGQITNSMIETDLH